MRRWLYVLVAVAMAAFVTVVSAGNSYFADTERAAAWALLPIADSPFFGIVPDEATRPATNPYKVSNPHYAGYTLIALGSVLFGCAAALQFRSCRSTSPTLAEVYGSLIDPGDRWRRTHPDW